MCILHIVFCVSMLSGINQAHLHPQHKDHTHLNTNHLHLPSISNPTITEHYKGTHFTSIPCRTLNLLSVHFRTIVPEILPVCSCSTTLCYSPVSLVLRLHTLLGVHVLHSLNCALIPHSSLPFSGREKKVILQYYSHSTCLCI